MFRPQEAVKIPTAAGRCLNSRQPENFAICKVLDLMRFSNLARHLLLSKTYLVKGSHPQYLLSNLFYPLSSSAGPRPAEDPFFEKLGPGDEKTGSIMKRRGLDNESDRLGTAICGCDSDNPGQNSPRFFFAPVNINSSESSYMNHVVARRIARFCTSGGVQAFVPAPGCTSLPAGPVAACQPAVSF